MGFMYANAYIICVRYVVASRLPSSILLSVNLPTPHPLPSFSTPTMPDGHWTSVRAYICSSALIYRICIAVNPHHLPSLPSLASFFPAFQHFSSPFLFFFFSFFSFFFFQLIYSTIDRKFVGK